MLLIIPKHPLSKERPPFLGLAYLAAALIEKGEEVSVIECQYKNTEFQEIEKAISNNEYIGIHANMGSIGEALRIAKFIRKISPDKKIIMGGPIPTVHYEHLIPDFADIVIIGEGERTIVELISEKKDIMNIEGIAFWHESRIKVNKRRENIRDLDKLPFPAWHIFEDRDKYYHPGARRPLLHMITSRGCPYRCSFCFHPIHHIDDSVRVRSPENVIAEIDELVGKFEAREIHIYDDNFTIFPDRVKLICELIIKKGYKDLRFSLPGGVRADKGDWEMFNLMAKAKFHSCWFGIESGSNTVLDNINKKLNLENVQREIEMASRAGINCGGLFMIGNIGDTIETVLQTVKFMQRLKLDQICLFLLNPHPGTEIYDYVRKTGKIFYSIDEGYPPYSKGKAICEFTDGLSRNQQEWLYREVYRRFFFRAKQIKGILRTLKIRVDSLEDITTLIRYGWNLSLNKIID